MTVVPWRPRSWYGRAIDEGPVLVECLCCGTLIEHWGHCDICRGLLPRHGIRCALHRNLKRFEERVRELVADQRARTGA